MRAVRAGAGSSRAIRHDARCGSDRVGGESHVTDGRLPSHIRSPFPLLFFSHLTTPVLVGLYEEPERPGNAVDYIKRYMGAPVNVDVEGLRVSGNGACEGWWCEGTAGEFRSVAIGSRVNAWLGWQSF